MRSIVCHKVGIDEQNPEDGRALEMLVSATASESCSRSYSASKNDIRKAQVDLQVALLDARVTSLLKGMMHFLRIDSM